MNPNICPYTIQNSAKSWSVDFMYPAKANAQSEFSQIVSTNSTGLETDNIPTPILLIVFLFIIFTILMSFVYIYHWTRFNMGDEFIKKATVIYIIGLIICSLPLIAFLL